MVSLDDVVDDLYGGPLDDFVARRDAAVRAARAAQDRDLARRIGALRKPTLAAGAVNLLVRDDPTLAGTLRDLGESLRDAERSLDGPALRDLGRQRRALVAGWAAQARRLAAAAGQPVSAAAAQEVERTLTAALADPRVAAVVAAGTLTHGTEHVGFGGVGSGGDDDAGADGGGVDGGAADGVGVADDARTARAAGADGGARRRGSTAPGRDADAPDRARAARDRERERRERETTRARERHVRAVAA
ncbi:hypothetical protein, partial [Cellulomonas iranensis]|uniref:hypothetical protein n=1 Tax=Cellulomonas iranensis TaxID=76862 RepID=UPI000B3C5850